MSQHESNMKPVELQLNILQNFYVNAYNALPKHINPEHLRFYIHENDLWAYPKAQYIFSLGSWSMMFTNNQWIKYD